VRRQRLTLELPAEDVPRAEALLELAGAETIALRDAADAPVFEPEPNTAPLWPLVTVEALFAGDADLTGLRGMLAATFPQRRLDVAELPDSAWQPKLEQAVKARPIGARLWLAPADDDRAPCDRAAVRIHMGLAFGTGEHPTTALCLDWIERHELQGQTVLDYGCGSGVLALAALALGAAHAVAVDNDPQALEATRANARLNGAGERLVVAAPDALPTTAVDVLLANILAGPLVELAPTFAGLVRPAGRLVLSGILERQAERVAAAYAPHFGELAQVARDGWVLLTARRRSVNRPQTR
jgi:ribosomal protein L11 methyltransferase